MAALLCGNELNRAKAIVGHGKWLSWLEAHCSDISDETARKWMRLANSNLDWNSVSGLKQAYLAASIIAEPETSTSSGEPQEKVDPFISWLERWKRVAVNDVPPEKRGEVKAMLQPIVEFYQTL